MKIDIRKGYFFRCIFTINSFIILLPIMGLVFLIISDDFIVFLALVAMYILLLVFFTFVILVLIQKKIEYPYLFLNNEYFSLVNKHGNFIDFENSLIYVDNTIVGFLISPYHFIFNYEMKYDIVIKENSTEYTRIYLTIFDYMKIKKLNYDYIKM